MTISQKPVGATPKLTGLGSHQQCSVSDKISMLLQRHQRSQLGTASEALYATNLLQHNRVLFRSDLHRAADCLLVSWLSSDV